VSEDRFESGRYLRALREHLPYVLGTTVLAVVAAVLFVSTAQKRYEAGTDVLVTPVPSDTYVGVPLLRESDVSRAVVAAARIATSPQIADHVARQLRLRTTRRDLLSHISVTPQEQSSIMTISATASTPGQSARLANAFADALIVVRSAEIQREVHAAIARLTPQLQKLHAAGSTEEATALAAQLSGLQALRGAADPTLQVVSRAVQPDAASWPRPVLSIVVALAAGFLLGMGIAIGIELVNPLVLSETDILEPGGPPILARVPQATRDRPETSIPSIGRGGRTARAAVAYRGLWANLVAHRGNRQAPEAVLVTGDGLALVAVALAKTLALGGRRVVVLDADARGSDVARLLELPSEPGGSGLRGVLVNDAALEGVLVATPRLGGRLRVLTSKPEDEGLVGLATVERLEALVQELKATADVVVVAAPDPAVAPDTLELAEVADAVIVAVVRGHTRRSRVAELRRDLGQRAIVPAGFVIISRHRLRRDSTQLTEALPASVGSPALEREPSPR
jgi:capsular polysaccharide biosynthesis protein/MinD-like ATPase involved in chromosome partitioning or flagellar assembly